MRPTTTAGTDEDDSAVADRRATAGPADRGQAYGRQASFLSRLTTGTGAFNILGPPQDLLRGRPARWSSRRSC